MRIVKKDRQFAVIGLGRFGSNMAKALTKMGYEVLAIDKNQQKVQEFNLNKIIQWQP